jgi:hypothetical protein
MRDCRENWAHLALELLLKIIIKNKWNDRVFGRDFSAP